VGFLIDTNVLAELRKGERGDPGVQAWYASISSTDIHISDLPSPLAVEGLGERETVMTFMIGGCLEKS
jgi:hypothetical protein